MITTPEREPVRALTLADLRATDWGDLSLEILVDPDTDRDRRARISRQGARALDRLLTGPADYLLLLEDDLRFNRRLRANLEAWHPLQTRQVTLGGLYNPGLRELAYDLPNHALAVEPLAAYGSQALLVSRQTAQHALQHWQSKGELPLDLRLFQLAADLGSPIYYHAPSLVQHQPTPSTWGGRTHQAIDYDPGWNVTEPQAS
jgi:hypothetical protein